MEIRKEDKKTKAEPLDEEELDQVNGGYTQKTFYCPECQAYCKYRICDKHHIDLAYTKK